MIDSFELGDTLDRGSVSIIQLLLQHHCDMGIGVSISVIQIPKGVTIHIGYHVIFEKTEPGSSFTRTIAGVRIHCDWDRPFEGVIVSMI